MPKQNHNPNIHHSDGGVEEPKLPEWPTKLAMMTMALGTITFLVYIPAIALPWMQLLFLVLSGVTVAALVVTLVLWRHRHDTMNRLLMLALGVVPLGMSWYFLHKSHSFRHGSDENLLTHWRGRDIALACHDHLKEIGRLPVDIRGPDQNRLLSWRVRLLPYFDSNELFKSFDLSQAWDSEHNRPLLAKKIRHPYRSPFDDQPPESTIWQAFVGKGTAFEEDGKELSLPGDFPDGTSNTILFAEARQGVPWSKPADMEYDRETPLPPLGRANQPPQNFRPFPQRRHSGFFIVMADATVHFLPFDTSEELLRALIVRNDGQPKDEWYNR